MNVLLAALTQVKMMTYGTTALVAVAVALLVWTLTRHVQRFGRERAEALADVDRGPNTVYHFIARDALLQLRIAVGLVSAGALAAVLICLQTEDP